MERSGSPLRAEGRLRRLDGQPVWSAVCFFVAKPFRRRGVSVRLLEAAVEFVRERGGRMVEGYPNRPGKPAPDAWVYTGLYPAFLEAGFVEAANPSPTRSIVRRYL